MMWSSGPTSRSRTALWLILLTSARVVIATFWTVTEYYQLSLSTSQYKTYTDPLFLYTYTTSYPVKSGVTPTAAPVSSTTYTNRYEDLTEVTLYLPPGAVAESDLVTTTTRYTGAANAYTYFVEPVVYTAPASCPTPFTVTTQTQVYVPSQVTDRVSPTSTSTSVATYGDHYTYVTAYLPPSAVPLSTSAGTSDFVYTYYIANCRNPTATGDAYYGPSGGGSGSSGSRSGGGDDSGIEVCALLTGCTSVATYIIVIATVLPTMFVLGFLESWLWFRNLMLGRTALRFGTICWIFISLWVICATRTTPSRTLEDQARLRYQWSGMSAATRVKLWFKWGFRHAYPTQLLGPDPKNPTGPGQDAPVMQMQMPPPGNPPFAPVAQMYAAPPPGAYQQQPGHAYPVQYSYYAPQGGPQQPFQVAAPAGMVYATPPPGMQAAPSPQPSQHMSVAAVSPVQSGIPPASQTHSSPQTAASELGVSDASETKGSGVTDSVERRD